MPCNDRLCPRCAMRIPRSICTSFPRLLHLGRLGHVAPARARDHPLEFEATSHTHLVLQSSLIFPATTFRNFSYWFFLLKSKSSCKFAPILSPFWRIRRHQPFAPCTRRVTSRTFTHVPFPAGFDARLQRRTSSRRACSLFPPTPTAMPHQARGSPIFVYQAHTRIYQIRF